MVPYGLPVYEEKECDQLQLNDLCDQLVAQ